MWLRFLKYDKKYQNKTKQNGERKNIKSGNRNETDEKHKEKENQQQNTSKFEDSPH